MGQGKAKSKYVVSIIIGLLVVLAVAFVAFIQNKNDVESALAANISITAAAENENGIDPSQGFIITSSEELSHKLISQYLKTQPAFEYTIEDLPEGYSYLILPNAQLKANSIYQLIFDPAGDERSEYQWAFQTNKTFGVKQTLPSDQSSQVPTNTGIEITFNQSGFTLEDAKAAFSIEPAVNGTFEKNDATLIFIPKEELQEDTIYTVTISKSFGQADSSSTLPSDLIFRFATKATSAYTDYDSIYIDQASQNSSFSLTQAPIFNFYIWSSLSLTSDVTIYKYSETENYVTDLQKSTENYWSNVYNELDKTNLNKAANFSADLIKVDYNAYLQFPDTLEKGYYVAEIVFKDKSNPDSGYTKTACIWFQVTNLSAYFAYQYNEGIVWLHNIETGQTASNASLTLSWKDEKLAADADGVAYFETDFDSDTVSAYEYNWYYNYPSYNSWWGQGKYILAQSGDYELVLCPIDYYYSHYYSASQNYWKYFYLDRNIYRPGDTVNFWGLVQGRTQTTENPSKVTIKLSGGNISSNSSFETEVNVTDGMFEGSYTLPQLQNGYYYLTIFVDDQVIDTNYLTVEQYEKPAYSISLETDKKAVFVGDTINWTATATYFEGTPLANLGLTFGYSWEENNQKKTTNAQGQATFQTTGTTYSDNYINTNYNMIYATLPESGEITGETSIMVFPSALDVESKTVKEEDKLDISLTAYNIDLSIINNSNDTINIYDEDHIYRNGIASGTKLNVELLKDTWKKVESGSYYDYYTKTIQKSYSYEYKQVKENTWQITTDANGKANIFYTLSDPNTSYSLKITGQDKQGRTFTYWCYVSNPYSNYRSWSDYIYMTLGEKESFKVGETVSATLIQNDGTSLKVADKGSVLYTRTRDHLLDYTVSDLPNFSFEFKEEEIPNVNLNAVYFDGRNYKTISSQVMAYFNPEEKALTTEITTDKTEYKPGDTVTLSVTLKDYTGKPIAGRINLNLVDEAIYAMMDQNVDFLNQLYSDTFHNYYTQSITHKADAIAQDASGGAEGGGEGESSIRTEFLDTVLFKTIEVGSNGKGEVSFELPDNLTSWRVTWHALANNLQVGSGTSAIVVRQDFFAEIRVNSTYLAGDKVIVGLRSAGLNLSSAMVEYTLSLQQTDAAGNSKVLWQNTPTGTPNTWVDNQLPEIEAGTYTIEVAAKQGTYSDALRKTFTVIESYHMQNIAQKVTLTDSLRPVGSTTGLTNLVFANYNQCTTLQGLYQLWGAGQTRVEQQIASNQAALLLAEYFEMDTNAEKLNLSDYQKSDGGIAYLSYSDSSISTSALVAAIAPEYFDTNAIANYFNNLLESEDIFDQMNTKTTSETAERANTSLLDASNSVEISEALLGLAALNEPILYQVRNLAAENELPVLTKINLALALYYLGDHANAKAMYDTLIASYGEDLGDTMRMRVSSDEMDDIYISTARMSLLASLFNTEEADKLYQYILQNTGEKDRCILEQLGILQARLTNDKNYTDVSFTYTVNDKTETVKLEKGQQYALTLTAEELTEIKFKNIEGNVGIVSYYQKPGLPTASQGSGTDGIKISRTYSAGDKTGTEFSQNSLIKIEINYTIAKPASNGLYQVVDILPAGLKLVSTGESTYLSHEEGQRLTFSVYVNDDAIKYGGKDNRQGTLTYYARVSSPGTFTAEAPYISLDSLDALYTLGEPATISIK